MTAEWEDVSKDFQRIKVPGGWAFKSITHHSDMYGKVILVTESMIFIPEVEGNMLDAIAEILRGKRDWLDIEVLLESTGRQVT